MRYKVSIITNDDVFFNLIEAFLKVQDENVVIAKITSISEIKSHYNQYFDLIIVDGNLTKNSPIELIYDMRYTYEIYTEIWFFTENIIPEYIKKAKEVGANLILRKPFNPTIIATKIKEFLYSNTIINQKP